MNYGPFKTDSERIYVIEDVRKPEIIFPSGWPAARVRQKSIVTWLLQHEPSKRPTALELSQSDLVPARIEDENIKSALSMIGTCFCSSLSVLLTKPLSQIGFPSLPGRSEHAFPPADRADPQFHL
jgi:translation initiation factor 2-alpha kinase 4